MLTDTEKIFFVVLTFFLMFGIGTSLEKKDFKHILKHPRSLKIGLISQTFFMPLWCFSLTRIFQLDLNTSIGLLLIGLTPGGAMSNIFCYVSKANVALSMSMTIVTTLMSFITYPFWVTIFLKQYPNISIPYLQIMGSLLIMLIPVLLGMKIKLNQPKLAQKLEKISSLSGLVLIVYLIVSGLYKNGYLLKAMSLYLFLAIISLQWGGFAFGWIMAKILKQDLANRKAIGMEIGIQNVPLSFSIILLSFTGMAQTEILQVPLLYGLSTAVFGCTLTFIFRCVLKN